MRARTDAPAAGPVTSVHAQPSRRGTSMRAHAAVAVSLDGRGRSRLARVASRTPLVLRPTIATGHVPVVGRDPSAARVSLATGAAGPVGGDDYRLDVHVGAGSTLVLAEVSATLALPGPHGEASSMTIRVVVEEGATLVWLPHPVIAAARCRHRHVAHIDLAADARLVYREELILGRHGEDPGDIDTRLAVRCDGAPILLQQLRLGPSATGSRSAAVVGPGRAVGSLVVVEPMLPLAGSTVVDASTAFMRLAGPTGGAGDAGGTGGDTRSIAAGLGTAVAPDAQELRRALDRLLGHLGDPWGSPAERPWSAVPR